MQDIPQFCIYEDSITYTDIRLSCERHVSHFVDINELSKPTRADMIVVHGFERFAICTGQYPSFVLGQGKSFQSYEAEFGYSLTISGLSWILAVASEFLLHDLASEQVTFSQVTCTEGGVGRNKIICFFK